MPVKALFVSTVSVTHRSFLLPFARHFRAQGALVEAAAAGLSECPNCVEAYDAVYDLSWTRSLRNVGALRAAMRQLRDLATTRGYDLVHVHTPIAAFATRAALRKLRRAGRVKVIYTAHGFHFHQGGGRVSNALFLALEKLAGRWTDALVVINDEDFQAARRHRLVPPERLVFMPGIGVDTSLYDPATVSAEDVSAVRHDLALAEADRLFLMVAEFNPGKRHRDALQAFALLNRPRAHLAFAGTGPEEPVLKALAEDLRVAEGVHFLGYRSDIPALIRASRATLLPSEREGLPRSVMESMCLGVPVVGTDIRGTRDLLADGCGLLVPLGDVTALSQAMARLLDSPDLGTELADNALQRVAEHDLSRIVALHEQLYARVLGRPTSP